VTNNLALEAIKKNPEWKSLVPTVESVQAHRRDVMTDIENNANHSFKNNR